MKINSTALAAGASTPAMRVIGFGRVGVCYVGDLDGETLSMEGALDTPGFDEATATWLPLFPNDSAATQETYTNSVNSLRPRVFQLPGGLWVRWTLSSGGGTPSGVYVLADGENLKPAASN